MAKRTTGTTKARKPARRPRATPAPPASRVTGRVSHRITRLPLEDVLIEAIDFRPTGELPLGRESTDQHGRYEIGYTPAERSLDETGVNLAVRALLPDGTVLATSDVLNNAPPNAVVDLVLDTTSSGPAEYHGLLDQLEVAGVELFHRSERVELVREAARRSDETGIPAELLYALGRRGLPLEPTALLSHDSDELRSALEEAARSGDLTMPAPAAAAELERRLPQLTARYTELARVGDATGIAVPRQLVSALAARGIRTLADIQASGGLAAMEDLPLPADDPAVAALDAHANLTALPIDLTTSRRLVDAEYRHILDVAETPPQTFAESLAGELSREEALAIHRSAGAEAGILANLITDARTAESAGDPAFATALMSVTSPACGCNSCMNATGPLVYLADLLDYAVRHMRYNGAPITVSWLARRFHQPFDRLPAACEWVERKIPQIRIAIEVLRAELQSTSAMSGYLALAYQLLLKGVGTSLEELREVMGPYGVRRNLAARLGIVLTPVPPGGTDELDELYAHGQHPPSEAALEGLFGLRDTNRDPLAPDAQPAFLAWRLEFLKQRWFAEDWPQNAPASTPPLIDPDIVGQADIAETSPNIAPNRATDFQQARQSELATYRSELIQFLTGPIPGSLDLLFQNVDETGHPLFPPWGFQRSVAEVVNLSAQAAAGADISGQLVAMGLTRPAFDFLASVAVAYQANPANVTEEAMATVSDILIQRVKERQFYQTWRTQERNAGITLTPDHFRLRATPLVGGAFEWQARPWRATIEARRKWEDTLGARTAQRRAAIESLEAAVRETEEAVLWHLRQYLWFQAQKPGLTVAQSIEKLTQQLGIDLEAGTCQKTTRVAQAIETVQALLFGARNGLLEDPGITLDAPSFDTEWQWIGSYATWRAAIQVFLYPENALRPTLRRRQTKAFGVLVDRLRQQGRVDGPAVQKELREYQDYFADICSLWPAGLSVTESLRIEDPFDPASIPLSTLIGPPDWFEKAQVLALAKGGDTGRYYFSTWKTRPGWGFRGSPSQALWDEIPGLRGAADLTSALPYQSGPGETSVAVHLRGSASSGGRFMVTTYNGTEWSGPTGLDRLPGFLTTSRYSADSLPPDPDLPSGAPRPVWQLKAGDQVTSADVDGDGRAEVIVLGGGLTDGVRRAALLRQRDGGLVVSWAGPLDSDWVLPNRPIRLLKSDNTYITRPYRTRLLVTDPARSKVGVLGYTDGQGLSVLWQADQVSGTSGSWTVATVAPPPGFSNEIVAAEPVAPGGRVFVFEYSPGTAGQFQTVNLSTVGLEWSGEGLSFLGRQNSGFGKVRSDWPMFESPWTNFHPMPNGDIGAVSWIRDPRITDTDYYFQLKMTYSMLAWDASTSQLTPRWTAYSGTGFKLSDPPITLKDLDGKPSTWQLRPEDRYFSVVGTFQPRVVLLNVPRRAAALLMDQRVVWQTEGQFEAEEGRDGDVWPIQDGDTILAAFTDEQSTPLLLFNNPNFGRLGLIAVIGDRLRTRWMGSGRIPAPGASAGQGWVVTRTARFAVGDVDMDRNPELITITPAEGGSGELALLHLLPGPVPRGLALKTGMPNRHGLYGVPKELIRLDYPPRLSASALEGRRTQSKTAYEQTINGGLEHNLIYLDEALYFVPIEIALRLSSSGRHSLALDWFRAVYEYDRPGGPTPVVHKLVLDGTGLITFGRELEWLQDPLDPHAVAGTRRRSYLKFTLLSLIRSLLLAADEEFTRATAESIPRARELYLEALELLRGPLLTQGVPSCEGIIGTLEVQIGEYDDAWVWHDLQAQLAEIKDFATLSKAVKSVAAALAADQPVSDRLAEAKARVAEALKPKGNAQTLVALVGNNRAQKRSAMNAAMATPVAKRWANGNLAELFRGFYSLDRIPAPMFGVCVPPNPVIDVLRRHATTNLEKIRGCRSIAGLEMAVEPYAAPTRSATPDELADAVRQLQGRPALQPLPYRYSTLVERARQLVEICRQIEASMLSALESRDRAAYDEIKARQDLGIAQAGVQLRDLQLNQANGGVITARLQRNRSQIQAAHYRNLIDLGLIPNEQAAMAAQLTSASLQAIPIQGIGGGGLAGMFGAMAQHYATSASYERRQQEWQVQEILAQQDVRIGEQQINQSRDTAQIAAQERLIAGMQAEHAETLLDFIANKRFGNADLYDWMSGILEQIYRFFLQQATSMAQLAEAQLAFERQEPLPVFIQADYWEPPRTTADGGDPVATAIAAALAASGQGPDRRGLTGSVRLLRDLTELDEYAFRTNQRKLQLSKTLSLALLDPIAFQQFRETGVLRFATPQNLFDRDFPGHYLRLIRRVRASVIALIPPNEGIRATLATTGPTRVIVAGPDFPTVVVRRGPESVALSSPMNATGLFELDTQPEMLVPFEFLGVEGMWEFRLPKAANRIDSQTIADVLITIDYTALDSGEYREQVLNRLERRAGADRAFSFRQDFADAWYDLHNPDQTATPMMVTFETRRSDFSPNIENLRIDHVVLYVARRSGATFEIPVTRLRFTPEGGAAVEGGSTTTGGIISTRRASGAPWQSMVGKPVAGRWELALPATATVRGRFDNDEIVDMLLVLSFSGDIPTWPA